MKIGIVGNGQLGWMLATRALSLGLTAVCYDPLQQGVVHPSDKSFLLPTPFAQFAEEMDILTYETENTALELVAPFAHLLRPGLLSLKTSQDRWLEKECFKKLGIPTAEYHPLFSETDLKPLRSLQYPRILKTCKGGYDGKGQKRVHDFTSLAKTWEEWGYPPCIIEAMIPFDFECSLIGARNIKGEIACYPLIHNTHEEGILRASRVPCDISDKTAKQALTYFETLLHSLNHVGVLTVEFFCQGDVLLANEMAPRVHNSGHWTIEGAHTSQFEQHLRAILGWPLGSTKVQAPHVAMLNLIGTMPPPDVCLQYPAFWHFYGKIPRPARKLGHVTVLEKSAKKLEESLTEIQRTIASP